MYCKNCGTQNDDGAKFCTNCGQPFEATAPVQPAGQPAPVAASESAPTGLKKILYAVGSIVSFLAIVLLFGLFFGGGTAVSIPFFGKQNLLVTTDFFKADGIWKTIIEGLKNGKDGVASVLGLLLSAILTFAGIITLLVFFIIGIVKFVKAMKGADYTGVTKTAIKAFGAFATIELLILSFNATTGVEFNSAALAAFCLGAILIGASIVLHFVANLKSNLGLKKLLGLCATVLVLVVGVIIAALAAGPVFKVGGAGVNFFSLFINEAIFAGETESIIYALLGWLSSFILVTLGATLIKTMFFKMFDHVDGRENAGSGLALTITSFIFGLILVVATYLYGKDASVDGAVPIVIMVFSLLATVGIIVRNKLLGK